jgi:hypothetical protein
MTRPTTTAPNLTEAVLMTRFEGIVRENAPRETSLADPLFERAGALCGSFFGRISRRMRRAMLRRSLARTMRAHRPRRSGAFV